MDPLFQLAGIAVTLGLLWATLTFLKRFRGTQAPVPRLQVQQRVQLAAGTQLVVVRWDGRELLLAAGAHSCTLIADKSLAEAHSACAR